MHGAAWARKLTIREVEQCPLNPDDIIPAAGNCCVPLPGQLPFATGGTRASYLP